MILAIIQARTSSTRLPGKTLMQLGSKTVLGNVISRVQRCKNIDGVLVATSTGEEDQPIIAEAVKYGALYYAGSKDDVLSRYYKAARLYKADRIVRITADCPFIMLDLVDELIDRSKYFEYGSNVKNRTYPKGLDCEVFSLGELERAHNHAVGEEREHVTPYIRSHVMQQFSMVDDDNFSHKRLTIDYAHDLRDMREFYPKIGHVYNYTALKKILPKLIGTEESNINMELGRV